jgi:hypothetical protein
MNGGREIGARSAIGWDSEIPNQLRTGYRDRGNEILTKDPVLLEPSAKSSARDPDGRPERFPESRTHCERTIYKYIGSEGYSEDVEPDFPTFDDGYIEQLLCEAIFESSRNGVWVEVSF